MALLGGQWDPVKVDSGRHAGTVAAEDEPGHSDAVPRKVDPEDVRVIGVVGMKPKAFEQRGHGTEGPNRELPAPDEDLDAGTDHGPRHHVRPLGAPAVPAAKVGPDLGALWYVGADGVFGGADQVAEQPLRLASEPRTRVPRPVGERHDTDAVVRREDYLRIEAWDHALVLDCGMPADVSAPKPEAHTRYSRVGLVVRGEHQGQRLGLEDRPVLAGTATGECGKIARHVPRR